MKIYRFVGVVLASLLGFAANAQQMPSRALESALPSEPLTALKLYSTDAPSRDIRIAPTAKQLAQAAADSRSGPGGVKTVGEQLGLRKANLPAVPLRVGSVFSAKMPKSELSWQPLSATESVTHLRVSSEGAMGIRARLVLPSDLNQGEIRVIGSADEKVISLPLSVAQDGTLWTPYTEGDRQLIEILARQPVTGSLFQVADIAHFEYSLLTAGGPGQPGKPALAASCTIDVACPSGNANLDAAITDRSKSVARINYMSNGSAFLCSGTVINSQQFPTPLFLTANHCISTTAEASSIQTDWFFQAIACGSSTANPQRVSVAGGAQLLYTNQMADSTLIRLNMMPPAGTVYSGWDANPLEDGDAVQSLSHPDGDVMKYAIGNLSVPDSGTGTVRIYGYPQDMYGVLFSRGIIEGGSSGSGLFTRSGTSLVLHGILSGSTLRSGSDLACDNLEENATYGRFDIFYTQIRPFLDNTPYPTDDHPNQPTPTATTIPLNGSVSGRIERAGDLDVFKIVITQAGTLAVGSRGGNDMIGTFLKADGSSVTGVASDDVELSSVNNEFGFTTEVTPGTYYVSVGTFDPNATTPGGYQVFTKFTTATENYTALWWNPNESGWGLNINHQSNAQGIIFATLFNYDLNGEAAWWVMSNGALQPDGSFFGELYRTTGPAFNSVPFTPIGAANITQVGTMRLTFQGPQNATLTYTINGITVTKQIVRQIFATLPTCKFSGFERSNSPDFLDFNFTDLYWNPSESGWGINLTHQSDIIFATLFNYGADGKGIWLVMSNGARTSDSEYIYQDDLYQTTGPAFNAEPFTPIGAANITKVGTMRIEFTERGDQALLTYSVNGVTVSKNIQRQVFADLRTACGNEF